NALEDAGLDVGGMDARPLALARACAPVTAARNGIAAALDLDWGLTTACVLFQGSIIYHRSTAETCLQAALSAVRESLGVSEDLAARILLRPASDNGPVTPL